MTAPTHFLSSYDIEKDSLHKLFRTADILQPVAQGLLRTNILNGLIVASLFFEPSTRTRLSFESAVARLGARCITVTGTTLVSISKGESYSDTAEVVSGYSDLVLLRTSSPDVTKSFAEYSSKPVINAGAGGDEHPTQALLDVYTLERELSARGKPLDNAHITITGDLKYGRTVHSLVIMLRMFKNITFHLVSPQQLRLPKTLLDLLQQSGHNVIVRDEHELPQAVAESDVIYTTRIQKERFSQEDAIDHIPDEMRVDKFLLDSFGKDDVVVMHPLPRDHREGSNDLPIASDDPRLIIFDQTRNGVPVRMALISKILGVTDDMIENTLEPTLLSMVDR